MIKHAINYSMGGCKAAVSPLLSMRDNTYNVARNGRTSVPRQGEQNHVGHAQYLLLDGYFSIMETRCSKNLNSASKPYLFKSEIIFGDYKR